MASQLKALRSVLVVLTALLMSGVGARAGVDPIPLPRPKPFGTQTAWAIPLPRDKPLLPATDDAPPATNPAAVWPSDRGRWPQAQVAAARNACEALLASRRMIWRPDTPIGNPGGCGTAAPIAVAEIAGIRIDPPATLNCDMAAAVYDWLSESVQPAAKRELGTPVVTIRNASSYACRRRNNGRGGKMSEHAYANALDIGSFVFAKRSEVTVAGSWSGLLQSVGLSGRGNFLRAVRRGSCEYFNTVLGPGTDSFHKDHFHVDLMKLRPGRFKMCR